MLIELEFLCSAYHEAHSLHRSTFCEYAHCPALLCHPYFPNDIIVPVWLECRARLCRTIALATKWLKPQELLHFDAILRWDSQNGLNCVELVGEKPLAYHDRSDGKSFHVV